MAKTIKCRRPVRLMGTSISCGVRELVGVSQCSPRELLKSIDLTHLAHVVFSDSTNRPHYERNSGNNFSGNNFAQFLRDNKLGRVVASPVRVNPNSYSPIAVWIWTPNKNAVEKFQEGLHDV